MINNWLVIHDWPNSTQTRASIEVPGGAVRSKHTNLVAKNCFADSTEPSEGRLHQGCRRNTRRLYRRHSCVL